MITRLERKALNQFGSNHVNSKFQIIIEPIAISGRANFSGYLTVFPPPTFAPIYCVITETQFSSNTAGGRILVDNTLPAEECEERIAADLMGGCISKNIGNARGTRPSHERQSLDQISELYL